ncbi:MAG TPA: alpha/beta hydrolase, partial [Acetobacterium sp.]|nr:alpha/beta hydrolase [Acetobacterium sp.]
MIDLTPNGFYASDEVKLTYYETPCPVKPKGIV